MAKDVLIICDVYMYSTGSLAGPTCSSTSCSISELALVYVLCFVRRCHPCMYEYI